VQCPYCGQVENRVIDSRLTRESQEIRRRRECAECERRFTTRERVEQSRRLHESGEAEVTTAWVGDLLLSELLALDTVAATRFASVFRRFQSADDYVGFWEKEVADAVDGTPSDDPDPEG
jgi:transcriptional repressor NrdR